MAWIEVVPEDGAGGELRALYDRVRDPGTAKVDNILKLHSLHPAGLRAHFELYAECMRGTSTLPRVEREMIALVVSALNRCRY